MLTSIRYTILAKIRAVKSNANLRRLERARATFNLALEFYEAGGRQDPRYLKIMSKSYTEFQTISATI